MASPSPVPPVSRVCDSSTCVKGWKIRSRCSGPIPIPVSSTSIAASLGSAAPPGAAPGRQRMVIRPPGRVNLTALERRLSRTWRTRSESPRKAVPRSQGSSTTAIPRLDAWGSTIATASATAPASGTGSDQKAVSPASTRSKSRTSLTSPSRWRLLERIRPT